MKYIIVGFIKIYQLTPGPWHLMCRHTPTCSNYTIDAIKEYGLIKGLMLSTKRILKCNPLFKPGFDPVIKRKV